MPIPAPLPQAFSFLPPFFIPSGDEVYVPRCIHEVPPPSLLISADLDGAFTPPHPRRAHVLPARRDCHEGSSCNFPPSLVKDLLMNMNTSPVSVSIRYDAYIQFEDEDFGLASFERSRVMSLSTTPQTDKTSERGRKLAVADREFHRTLELLNEQARLLSQFADLDLNRLGEAMPSHRVRDHSAGRTMPESTRLFDVKDTNQSYLHRMPHNRDVHTVKSIAVMRP